MTQTISGASENIEFSGEMALLWQNWGVRTPDLTNFHDFVHIEKLRKDLWCGREYGRAAVMVGAGFSRNADPIAEEESPFPLWNEIVLRMLDELEVRIESKAGNEHRRIHQRPVAESALRIAQEYEVAFGRAALDHLLVSVIRDERYRPGKLHQMLLKLPWSDVFTTNYDTLLERTRPSVHERKYEVLQNAADIPGGMKPRIIKLNGGFPSGRPFVITEDDFRTYPREFAPLVNTVQQAVMESSFCLIGFSGDDPNFLAWSGWVRDHLGEHTRPMYLCGLLNLTPAQRSLLEQRRVIPIDLSPLFPPELWPSAALRHARALEWFLLTLQHGEPVDPIHWLENLEVCRPASSQGLPSIPGPFKSYTKCSALIPKRGFEASKEELSELLRLWGNQRRECPGWVVLPPQNMKSLWSYTSGWFPAIFRSISSLEAVDRLLLLFELNWRFERCLLPLFIDQVAILTTILESINPFPQLLVLPDQAMLLGQESIAPALRNDISYAWVELAFAVMREAREDLDEARFKLWYERLFPLADLSPSYRSRLYYEECLFALHSLDLVRTEAVLVQWRQFEEKPFWRAKLASLLAEIGRVDQAYEIASDALTEIRAGTDNARPDFASLSQEGWVMALVSVLEGTDPKRDKTLRNTHRNRWARLDSLRCNPWETIDHLRQVLSQSSPNIQPSRTVSDDFDPGKITVSEHYSSNLDLILPAFQALRLSEETGCVFKVGHIDMLAGAATNAAKWIAPLAPFWSLVSLARSGNEKALGELFPRYRVATLSAEQIGRLYQLALAAANNALTSIENQQQDIHNRMAHRFFSVAIELLSRISFRLQAQALRSLFDLLIRVLSSKTIAANISFHTLATSFCRRVLFALCEQDLAECAPQLLQLPVAGEEGFVTPHEYGWPEPCQYDRGGDAGFGSHVDMNLIKQLIARFTKLIERGNTITRTCAIQRLWWLLRAGQLTQLEEKSFADALWARLDPDTGLIGDTSFSRSFFLHLPGTLENNAREKMRSFYLRTEFPDVFVGDTQAKPRQLDGSKLLAFKLHIQGVVESHLPLEPSERVENYVDWTEADAQQLLEKGMVWWNLVKASLPEVTEPDPAYTRTDSIRDAVYELIDLVGAIILPKIQAEGAIVAASLLEEIHERKFCILEAIPMTLHHFPQQALKVSEEIARGIFSTHEREVRDGMFGLVRWARYAKYGKLQNPSAETISVVANHIRARRETGLSVVLQNAAILLEEAPDIWNDDHIAIAHMGLEFILREVNLSPDLESRLSSAESQPNHRLSIRKAGGSFAKSMFDYYQRRSLELSETLKNWQQVCQTDALPEVRRAWDKRL